MRDIISQLETWSAHNEPIAVATVVQTWGSSPRQVGAKMAVIASGMLCGSVSGGCVEAAVVETAFKVLQHGQPKLLHFGVAEETAWDVGLACGGTIEVFVKRLDTSLLEEVQRGLASEQTFAVVTVIQGAAELLGRDLVIRGDGTLTGMPLGDGLDTLSQQATQTAIAAGQSQRVMVTENPPLELFIDVFTPEPELVIIGGVHIAVALTNIAKVLGYRTTIIDPRTVFGNEHRFPHADRLMQTFPDSALAEIRLTPRHAVVSLSHDPKLDDPAVRIALHSPAFYVGALGSKATQQRRREKLIAEGMLPDQLARLHGPVGLDLGGRTPEELALAIMAEIVAVRNARTKAIIEQSAVVAAH